MGNGTYENDDTDFYYGKIEKSIFKKFTETFPDDILKFAGKYILKQDGIPCRIQMKLYNENDTIIYEFVYGSHFSGLPDEIRSMIASSIGITDNWYHDQQEKPKAKEIAEHNQPESL